MSGFRTDSESVRILDILPSSCVERIIDLSSAYLSTPYPDRPRLRPWHRSIPSVEAHVAAVLNADGPPCPLRESRRWWRCDVREVLGALNLHGRDPESMRRKAERAMAMERRRREMRERELRAAIPPPPPLPDRLLERARARGELLRRIRADLDGLDAATGGRGRP